MSKDTIYRQDAIDIVMKYGKKIPTYAIMCKDAMEKLPSAETEIKPIEYKDCACALIKMWMDNVLTDGEYNRIMDKLNAMKGKENE